MGKPRIEFIDLAKGVCILFVVLGHCKVGTDGYIPGALRMPLYFILSGLFFKDYGGFFYLFEKKINKLIVPFLFFFFVGVACYFYTQRRIDYIYEPFITNMVTADPPIWFLICLFWTNLIFCLIYLNVKSLIFQGLTVVGLWSIGYVLSLNSVYLPLFFGTSLSALPFFFVGFLLRKTPMLFPNKFDRFGMALAVALLAVGVAYSKLCGKPQIAFREHVYIGNPLEILLLSVCLVLGILLFCKSIRWLPIVSYIGRFSIVVLVLHGFVAWHIPAKHLGISPWGLFLITMIICWLAIPFMIRYLPRFTAQKDLIYLPRRNPRTRSVEATETVEAEKN